MNIVDLNLIRVDGGTQSRASIYQNTVDDYAQAISDGALFPPVVLFYDGQDYWLADGFHRHAAYEKAGKDRIPADVRQGTRRDAILFAVGANDTHGLRRTNEDKRRAVLTLLNDEEWGGWSNREIARRCAVSSDTVDRLRASLPVSGSDARTYTTKHGTVATMNTANIGTKPSVAPYDPVQAQEIMKQAKAIADAEPTHVLATLNSGDNEWYTPMAYIDAARAVLGTIDLDPATCDFAQRRVKATEYFTIDDDGLAQQWKGNVWMNPPYSKELISRFVSKMVAEVQAGNVEAAIMLTNTYSDTSWFHEATSACSAICFTRGRIKFEKEDGAVGSPTIGQSFFYFGPNLDLFQQVFGTIGFVMTPNRAEVVQVPASSPCAWRGKCLMAHELKGAKAAAA